MLSILYTGAITCTECGSSFFQNRGRPRSKCYSCCPKDNRKKKLSCFREPKSPKVSKDDGVEFTIFRPAPKVVRPKPIVYPEVQGATYFVVVHPWSKLRSVEEFSFSSRNEAEKVAQQFRDFGERVVFRSVYANSPVVDKGSPIRNRNSLGRFLKKKM